jgi:hypothetical protein
MKKVLASCLVTAGLVAGAVASATPAQAVEQWVNGKFISSGSSCVSGYTGCKLKVDVGPLDCRPFLGADLNRCINESTTRDYRYPVVWRSAKVLYCGYKGVTHGARIDASGVISKLNGAIVTVAYGSTSDNKTDYIRCH